MSARYDAPVQQSRAVFAPKGTPQDVIARLQKAFQAAFKSAAYKKFNEENQLTPNEVDGAKLLEQWTANLDKYRSIVQQNNIDLGGDT